jgi:hypothetical protein
MSQLLQRAPPATLTAEQQAQLLRCYNVIIQLEAALHEAPSLKMQLVDAMLKQQVACSVGRLVAWVQQQPVQQQSDVRAVVVVGQQGSAPVTGAAGSTTSNVWAAGVHLVEFFAVVAFLHNPESAELTANLTQQLDRSGKACSCNCDCTDDAVVATTRHPCTPERMEASISRSVTCVTNM